MWGVGLTGQINRLFGTPWAAFVLWMTIILVSFVVDKPYRKWKLYKRIRGDKAIPYEKKSKKDSVDAEPPHEEPQQKQE